MLLKVRKGPREQLTAIIGTEKGHLSDFSDDTDDEEEVKTPARKSA